MTETQAIVEAYRQAAADNIRAALATVVRVEGSAYRQPGARMLVTETGQAIGLVSGGCLESDIRERAARVMRTGQPARVTYDTAKNRDVVWGLGSGCEGIVHVLIEPASAGIDGLVRFLDASSRSERRGAFATVIRSAVTGLPLGTRVFRCPDDEIVCDAGIPPEITHHILADLLAAVRSGVSFVTEYGAGAVEVFIEVVEPPVPLVIFGAGADAVPLVTIAHQLGWHTTVVDTRARAGSERFATADAIILCRPEEVSARVTLTESTVVVVMTHDYLHDLEVLKVLVDQRLRYLGCLGPRQRTERLLSQLRGAPLAMQSSFGRAHAPVGLDIGAESPPEIALSIAAEILAVLRERSGGPLHRRDGAIHGDRFSEAWTTTSPARLSSPSPPSSSGPSRWPPDLYGLCRSSRG